MPHTDDLRFAPPTPVPPQGSVGQSRPTGRMARSVELPATTDRAARAQAALDQLVEEWRLPRFRAGRWLAAADVLTGDAPLEMYVQLDCTTNLLTLELWTEGKVVFGIDDWLGL